MSNPQVSNPNDYKVVSFHNNVDFGFTPEMGCMYDGRPITGRNGLPGLEPGEKIILPYHVGHRLAINLAKRVLNTSPAASVDPAGIPTGVPIWSEAKLKETADTYVTEFYTESKPTTMSETDRMMAKVEEYRKQFEKELEDLRASKPKVEEPAKVETEEKTAQPGATPLKFQDKQEIISELEKRGVKHDKRKTKAELEKLLS